MKYVRESEIININDNFLVRTKNFHHLQDSDYHQKNAPFKTTTM